MKDRPMLTSIVLFAALVLLLAAFTKTVRGQSPVIRYVEHDLDIGHLITALKQTENWDGKTQGGRGEWGPLQMLPGIYRRFAKDERGYIRHLIGECHKLNKRPTAWLIGLLHNAGYPAVRDHHALAAKLDFAQRVENLYNELNR